MGRLAVLLGFVAIAIGIVATPLTASGPPRIDAVSTFTYTSNLTPLGFSARPNPASGVFNSDLAFWGDWAIQGTYDGFRIVDITYPQRPREVLFQPCNGNQGDIVVWGQGSRPNVLLRSYNSPAPAGLTCDGQPIAAGFEGFHVFDLSNFGNPQLVASVQVPCGSHTATLIPDTANNRLIVYNQTSGGDCPFITIVSVPLGNLAGTSIIGQAPLMHAGACHDSGVILGKVNKMVCASHAEANVFDIGANEIPGGSLTNPQFLFTLSDPGVGVGGNWHSAAWTYDGEVIILGWEPGGGSQPRCTATGTMLPGGVVQTDAHKSYFFYNARTGAQIGKFVLPRNQTVAENCTIHNYTVVPLKNKNGKPRYVLVAGNYQAGISVVDFTNPAAAREVAYADPAPLVPTQLGGDWSTYWYNGRIYESDITRGLMIWRLDDPSVATYYRTPHSNPQTQEFSIDPGFGGGISQ